MVIYTNLGAAAHWVTYKFKKLMYFKNGGPLQLSNLASSITHAHNPPSALFIHPHFVINLIHTFEKKKKKEISILFEAFKP